MNRCVLLIPQSLVDMIPMLYARKYGGKHEWGADNIHNEKVGDHFI